MKTAEVELSCHSIGLNAGISGTEIGNGVRKNPLFCLHFIPKTSFYQSSLLGLLGGQVAVATTLYDQILLWTPRFCGYKTFSMFNSAVH